MKERVEGLVLFVSTKSTIALYCTKQWQLAYEAMERAPLSSTSFTGPSQPGLSVWWRCSLSFGAHVYRFVYRISYFVLREACCVVEIAVSVLGKRDSSATPQNDKGDAITTLRYGLSGHCERTCTELVEVAKQS